MAQTFEHVLRYAGFFEKTGDEDEKGEGDKPQRKHPAENLARGEGKHAGTCVDKSCYHSTSPQGKGHGDTEKESYEKEREQHS